MVVHFTDLLVGQLVTYWPMTRVTHPDLLTRLTHDSRHTDPLTHDSLTHDQLTHDPLTHDSLTHDQLTHDPLTHCQLCTAYINTNNSTNCTRDNNAEKFTTNNFYSKNPFNTCKLRYDTIQPTYRHWAMYCDMYPRMLCALFPLYAVNFTCQLNAFIVIRSTFKK